MEFKLLSPTTFSTEITFNKQELITEIKNRLAKYENLVYDFTQIKEAKTDRATLNALRTAIEDKRKEIKKQCLEPYENFEKDVKEVIAIIDQPLLGIDNQIKAYEDIKREEKRKEIENYYKTLVSKNPILGFLQMERFFDDRWLNTTLVLNAIFKEIDKIAQDFLEAFEVIRYCDTENYDFLIDKFIQTLSVTEVLKEENRLKTFKKALNALTDKKEHKEDLTQAAINAQAPLKKYEVRFRVTATANQLRILKECLINNNIDYSKE